MHIWKHTCLLLAHFGTKCINVKWIYFKKHYRGTECKYYKDPSINSLLILSKLNSYLNYPFTYTNCMFLMHLHSTLKQGLYQFFLLLSWYVLCYILTESSFRDSGWGLTRFCMEHWWMLPLKSGILIICTDLCKTWRTKMSNQTRGSSHSSIQLPILVRELQRWVSGFASI